MSSGTSALHLVLRYFNVGSEDEVLVPSLTYVATANAVTYCGATPNFLDIETDSLGVCPKKLVSYLKKKTPYDEIIFMTPDGDKLNQSMCNKLSLNKNIILLCGHYKGIDQRVRDHLITQEISIGDYVLSGGELAAMVVADSLIRLIPGVLNDESSALTDSFQDSLLAPPVYTRPAVYKGWEVPKILLSGNDAAINDWRYEAAIKRTKDRRPHLLD